MARRSALSSLTRRFDISWFAGAIAKYRGLLGEVLVASFFLQVFALVSPLFFQVVIDKVFPLSDAAGAHAYIESRQAVGRVVMVP
ncbi:MAG: zinc-binding dehydrogenase [Brevundimonas sp.]